MGYDQKKRQAPPFCRVYWFLPLTFIDRLVGRPPEELRRQGIKQWKVYRVRGVKPPEMEREEEREIKKHGRARTIAVGRSSSVNDASDHSAGGTTTSMLQVARI